MRANASRVLLAALLVLGLVALVSIAAGGSTPAGTNDGRPPSDSLLDTTLSFFLLAMVAGAAILVYGLMQREGIAQEIASGRYRRAGLVSFLVFLTIIAALGYWRLRNWDPIAQRDEFGETPFEVPGGTPGPVIPPSETAYEPRFAWVPVLIVLGLLAVALVASKIASRRRRQQRSDSRIASDVADVLDETLDDLQAEKDYRKAVIAAYARLERVLGAHELGRKPSEAPGEYLLRILPHLEVERGSVRRLTELFAQAKFSTHDVDARMKEQAIDALSTVRDELRAAAERQREKELEPPIDTAKTAGEPG